MKNIMKKIRKFEEAKEEIDDYIWSIFTRYKNEDGIGFIYFSDPDNWEIDWEENCIIFRGQDGCRGCYDSHSEEIPIEFFIDYDKALKEIRDKEEEEKRQKKLKAEKVKKENKRKKELKEKEEYERLKKKYEGVNTDV